MYEALAKLDATLHPEYSAQLCSGYKKGANDLYADTFNGIRGAGMDLNGTWRLVDGLDAEFEPTDWQGPAGRKTRDLEK